MRVNNKAIPFFLSMLTLAACGGSGGDGGGVVIVAPSAVLSTLRASPSTAPADGVTQILLTVLVRDTDGQAMAGLPVRFDAQGVAANVQVQAAATGGDGVVTALVTSSVVGTVTVSALIDPDDAAVRIDDTVTLTFVDLDTPVVAGPARFVDVDRNAVANAGDLVIVPFSTDVTVNGAIADDFALPVADDSFGIGATVAAGPAANEVAITLGDQPRLRTRGQFDIGAVVRNAPSGVGLLAGDAIISTTGVAAVASGSVDIGPSLLELAMVAANGQRFAVGDLNVDGQPDLVVSNSGSLQPFVNDNGAFVPATIATGQAADAIEIANLNRIGNPEVVTGDVVGVRIWNVNGATGQTPSLQESGFVATGPANDVVLVDIDTDAFLDIVAATPTGVVVARHQRNLGNTYVVGQSLSLAEAARKVIAADVDGDGDRDVLVLLDASVRVLRNDVGTLVEDLQLPAVGVEHLDTGDVDGDGVLELLFSGQGGATLWQRDALGDYQSEALGVVAQQAELADFDGDARDDVLARTGDGLELLANDRAGGFVSFAVFTRSGLVEFATADFDRDGDRDLVALGGGTLRSFAGSLAGTFGDTVLAEAQQLGSDAISKQLIVEVNGDGQEDRIVLTQAGADVWLGDGAGGFVLANGFGSSQAQNPVALAVGDLDGDLDLDCVLGFAGAANEAFVNDGQGQFTFAWSFSAANCISLAMTDYDEDGDLDVFVGNDGDNEVYRNDTLNGVVQLSLQQDAFDNLLPVALGNETIAVLPIDFDRDGDEDVIVVNGGTLTEPQDAYVLRRSAAGYTLLNTLNAQLLATGAALGDVDGDGRKDLAIAQLSSNGSATVKWFRGFATSLSTLSTNVASNGQYVSRSLIIADVDGDGDSDFVIGDVSVSNQPIAVLQQQPNGTFVVGQELATTRLETIGAGDFDNDGDIDLVTVETTGPSRVLENR